MKAFGLELPVLASVRRQVLLAALGAVLLVLSIALGQSAPAESSTAATAATTAQPGRASGGTLYAYYEIGVDRRPTDVDGQLTVDGVPGALPLFDEIEEGMILKALSPVHLRAEPTSNSGSEMLDTGDCVRVISGERVEAVLQRALSGGWLPVKLSTCPRADRASAPVPAVSPPSTANVAARRTQPPPENACEKLPMLAADDWPQTQISASAFVRARVRSTTFYIVVRDGGDESSNVLCETAPNTVLDAFDHGDGWSQVRLATGHLGFMKTSGLAFIG